MTVLLTALESNHQPIEIGGLVAISGSMFALAIAAGSMQIEGTVPVYGDAEITVDSVTTPDYPPNIDGSIVVSGDAELGINPGIEVDGEVYLSGEMLPDGTYDGTVYISGEANSNFNFVGNYIFAVEEPEVVSAYAGMSFSNVTEEVHLHTQSSRLYTQVTRSVAAVFNSRRARYEGVSHLDDTVVFAENIDYILRILIEEGAIFNGIFVGNYQAVGRAFSRVLMDGTFHNYAEAFNAMVDAFVVNALSDALPTDTVTESVVLNETIDTMYAAFARVLETVLAGDEASNTYALTVVLRDVAVFNAYLAGQVDLVTLLRESVGFTTQLRFDDGNRIAWAINTESQGVSRYTNYPFNSMARIGNRYYGLHTGGVVRLDGNDDAGDPINARLRLGMYNFGTNLEKSFSEVYVGATNEGQLLLKVIFVNDGTGEKNAAIYAMKVRPANAERETRFEPGKGIKAVSFDYELTNVDGGDFDIRNVEFQPMFNGRRTRG